MTDARCLILGGCGFIGSHVADALLRQGYKIRIFDRLNIRKENVVHLLGNVEVFEGDFVNMHDVEKALEGMDIVLHFVSSTVPQSSQTNPVFDVETNVIPTVNLLDLCVKKRIRKILFASSGGTVYGMADKMPITETDPTNPICAYGISKLMIEKYLHLYRYHHGLDYVTLRFSNPYGERQSPNSVQGAVPVFLGRVKKGEPITVWGDGSVERDFLYIGDLAEASVKALESNSPTRIFNIAYGKTTSINCLITTIRKVTGQRVVVNYVSARKFDLKKVELDTSAAKEVLGWSPKTSLEEGIEKTWKWIDETHR